MIICPSCREEIEEQSYYCDQCGQALLYCSNCGRVGIGRRCTYCGGLMESAEEQANKPAGNTNSTAADISRTFATARENYNNAPRLSDVSKVPISSCLTVICTFPVYMPS